MKIEKLKIIEDYFYETYPKGFEDEAMLPIVKRHNIPKVTALAREYFAPDKFVYPEQIIEDMTKTVSKSSMISLFDKPKFRDETKAMSIEQKDILCIGLSEFLHGNQKSGFEMMLEVLVAKKLARWSLISVIPYYYTPDVELFVKPTTTKGIINYFEIKDIVYKPRPSYEFYTKYKEIIEELKYHVNPSLRDDNAKFTGFLMMGMQAMGE